MSLPSSMSSHQPEPVKPVGRYGGLSVYGWTFWLPILVAGTLIMVVLALLAAKSVGAVAVVYWVVFGVTAVVTLAALAFFRDPDRLVPQEPGVMVSPADGMVTEITVLQEFPQLVGALRGGGGAKPGEIVRLGIFLSVLDVHLNRSPCDGVILEMLFTPGRFLDARHPKSGIENQSNALLLGDPQSRVPVAVVKQIVGAIARRIITPVRVGESLARGQRFGMIAFGSRTELYLRAEEWEFTVQTGQKLKAGRDIVARRKVRST